MNPDNIAALLTLLIVFFVTIIGITPSIIDFIKAEKEDAEEKSERATPVESRNKKIEKTLSAIDYIFSNYDFYNINKLHPKIRDLIIDNNLRINVEYEDNNLYKESFNIKKIKIKRISFLFGRRIAIYPNDKVFKHSPISIQNLQYINDLDWVQELSLEGTEFATKSAESEKKTL